MMMTERDMNNLDQLLNTARRRAVPASDDLMARVLADAVALQPAAGTVRPQQTASRTGWLRDLIGGWPALSGVLAAGLTGLWVGVAPPTGVESLAATMIGTTQTVTFLPETDFSLFEDPSDG
ncbi:dihydroorotate dehydrogenase [Loktanella sp. R86503]|uniref:dihydroorotate dehydrogenase n=1 Tax=Loktanella TaxID=245186 RepID=UPI0036D7CEEE